MVCKKSVHSLLYAPTPAQLEFILNDINEIDENKLKQNEKLINDWIRCQDHFPKDIDQGFIRGMIRGSKHFTEKTKQKLEHHLAARHMYPELYKDRLPTSKEIVQAMDTTNIALMPLLTPEGYRIHMFALHRYDVSEFNFQNAVKLFFMLYEFLISSDTVSSGEIAIFDAAHFTAGHLAKWFGPFLKTLVVLLKEAYALRLKEVHIINAPTPLLKMVQAVKPLFHAKVRNSVYIHDNPSALVDIFGADHLPSNYGGRLKTLREIATDWYSMLNDNTDWFEAQQHVKITELPKKIHSTLYLGDQLGVEGSFRKLEID